MDKACPIHKHLFLTSLFHILHFRHCTERLIRHSASITHAHTGSDYAINIYTKRKIMNILPSYIFVNNLPYYFQTGLSLALS
jgi:hypothetical protein